MKTSTEEELEFKWNWYATKSANMLNWRAIQNRLLTWDSLVCRNAQLQSTASKLCEELEDTWKIFHIM